MTASDAPKAHPLIRPLLAGKLHPKLEKQLETLTTATEMPAPPSHVIPGSTGIQPLLASSGREHGRQEPHQTTPHHVIPGLTRNPLSCPPRPSARYTRQSPPPPLRTGLRQDQIESYASYRLARAATAERPPNTKTAASKSQIVAYIDAATTDICPCTVASSSALCHPPSFQA